MQAPKQVSDPLSPSSATTGRASSMWWRNWLTSTGALLPNRSDYAGIRRTWRGDLIAGLTVAVVALPLALAFGVASGMGATAGLVTAIVAGAIAGIFGGSNFQVSGPTGAMTVVLVPLVAHYGQPAALTVAVMAGVLVVIMGITGLGKLVTLIPWPVIEGFTVGIALIIALQQIPNALGVTESTSDNTTINAINALTEVTAAAIPEIVIATLTIVLILLLTRIRKSLPASLIAVAAATAVTAIAGITVPTVGEIPNHLPSPTLPDLSPTALHTLFGSAVAVAVLAAIESLLSAKVADGMADSTPSKPNRELFGQGLANIGSGLFGGMPATGAIARTAVNVRAGASTRLAAVVHSVVLLVIILVASELVADIPLATLGGVLLVTAYRMVEPRTVRALLRSENADRVVFVLTACATVAFDLIVAVEIGIVLAAVLALLSLAKASGLTQEPLPDLSDHVDTETEHRLMHEHIVIYRIDGSMFFGAAQRFLDELTSISDVRVVILRMSGMTTLDATGANALRTVVKDLNARHIVVLFKGLQPAHEQQLTTLGVLHEPDGEGDGERDRHSFATLDDAIAHARTYVLAPAEATQASAKRDENDMQNGHP